MIPKLPCCGSARASVVCLRRWRSQKLVGRLLGRLGFSRQANSKTREGASHPVRLFDAEVAAGLNQSRPFMLRLDILARLPLTRAWFPDMEQPGRGIISVAPTLLQEELTRLAANLVRRRRDLLDIRGP